MKQELDLSSLLEATQSHMSKKSKVPRKRQIRKDNSELQIQKQKKLTKEAKRQLSREEKMRLQKEKNRFHAQKSRDQHKQYVSCLENEVKYLRQELERSKYYCSSCKKTINLCEQKSGGAQTPVNLQLFSRDELDWKQDSFDMNEAITQKGEPASFLRIFEEKEDHHLLKMVLFVVAVVLAVFFINGPSSTFDKGVMIPSIQTYSAFESSDMSVEQVQKEIHNETLQNLQHKEQLKQGTDHLKERTLFDSLIKQKNKNKDIIVEFEEKFIKIAQNVTKKEANQLNEMKDEAQEIISAIDEVK